MPNERDFCPDCGQAGVTHAVEYISVALRLLLSPALPFTANLIPHERLRRVQTPVYSYVCNFAEKLGVGSYLTSPDEHTLLLTKVLWEAAPSRGIVMKEFRFNHLPRNSVLATLPDGKVIDFDSIPTLPNTKAVWWLDNKAALKERLAEAGIPVPQGQKVSSTKNLHAVFDSLPKPLIVKPIIGSASRHTTLHIKTLADLERAVKSAKQIAPFAVVEEEIPGAVYRPTVLQGKVIATLRRDTPHIIGDGVNTIRELVTLENQDPERNGPYFSKLNLDLAQEELKSQNLSSGSIPPAGIRVQLNPKINWSVGGTTTDVTDDVHPENIKLFEKIAGLLQAPLVGIDFIIEDISRPWHEQRSGVIECNTMPYFDNHHLPFKGKPRDVAGPYWDMFLKAHGL